MTTDNWQQFKEVFEAALELPPQERSAYLDRICTEPAMRAELNSLLFCYQNLEDSSQGIRAKARGPLVADAAADPLTETFIDHYQIIGRIDERGSQSIYRAVCAGGSDLKQVVLRLSKVPADMEDFRALKRQRIALMGIEHPRIPRLLDAGITKHGCPYLVTEYVEGLAIDRYCDVHKLSTKSRLELFVEACRIVQFAHEHFIAHGSLTAESVVVSRKGEPVVTDLGIAALLDGIRSPDPDEEPDGAGPEALEYASPEQSQRKPIAAADDVYSLGVLLYRLMTGRSPYRVHDGPRDSVFSADLETTVPSKAVRSERSGMSHLKSRGKPLMAQRRDETVEVVQKFLAGDLDSIILKAMQKDAAKRYQSVEHFLADIQHHLEHRAVSCMEPTFRYRFGKFIHRNRAIAITALLATAATAMAAAFALAAWFRH